MVMAKTQADKFKVIPYCVNKGTSSEYYGLMAVEKDNKWVLRAAPNNWKTERGAVNWGRKHGYNVTVGEKKLKATNKTSRKQKKEIKKMLDKITKKSTVKKATPKKTATKKTTSKKSTSKKTR